jgi:magnesium chelatase subunit I
VDQKSGVSARMTRAALEDLISAAERRALLHDEDETTARISDLMHIEPAITGKIELVYEGEQEGAQNVARLLIGRAVKSIFTRYFPDPSDKKTGRSPYQDTLGWFTKGNSVVLKQDMPLVDLAKALDAVDGLRGLAKKYMNPSTPGESVAAMEFVLEALHQHSLIGKDLMEAERTYTDIMGSMLSSLGSLDDDDFDDDDDDFYRRYRG